MALTVNDNSIIRACFRNEHGTCCDCLNAFTNGKLLTNTKSDSNLEYVNCSTSVKTKSYCCPNHSISELRNTTNCDFVLMFSICVLKLLFKLSEHLNKMQLKWFILCLLWFGTHKMTLARPNIDTLHSTNLADSDTVNLKSSVSINFVIILINSYHFANYT